MCCHNNSTCCSDVFHAQIYLREKNHFGFEMTMKWNEEIFLYEIKKQLDSYWENSHHHLMYLGWHNKFTFTDVCNSIHKQFWNANFSIEMSHSGQTDRKELFMRPKASHRWISCSCNFMAVNLSRGWKATLMTATFGLSCIFHRILHLILHNPLPIPNFLVH